MLNYWRINYFEDNLSFFLEIIENDGKSVFINEHASKRWDFAPDDFIFILFFENNP